MFTRSKHHILKTVHKIQTIRNMHLLKQQSFINGEWVSSPNTFEIKNPANGKTIANIPNQTVDDTQKAINAASEAYKTWSHTTAKERSNLLRKWYDLLVENQSSLAEIMTAESGKPLHEASLEVGYGNSFIEWFSEEARRIRGEIIPSPATNKKIMVEREPIGVVGLITPWNFPHAMITRKAGAALAAGCTCVIRPAEDTPLTALALMELANQAGIPKGVLNVVTSDRSNAGDIGKLLCESPQVAGISFTGSTTVGQILYKQCAPGIKRLSLELGGNAPFIVFDSANIETAIKSTIASKFRNCGQTCISANRFLIQENILECFTDKIVQEVKKLKMGDGTQNGVQLGPLINTAQLLKVSAMVDDAVSKGAKVLTGGKAAPSVGELFYEPTVITNLAPNMRLYNEEVFGPVVNIIPFKTEEEALTVANSTNSGLAGYFFSEDVAQIFRVARRLEVGILGVNEGAVSAAEAPFGGVKQSGLGREGSHQGIEEFTNYKYICLGNL